MTTQETTVTIDNIELRTGANAFGKKTMYFELYQGDRLHSTVEMQVTNLGTFFHIDSKEGMYRFDNIQETENPKEFTISKLLEVLENERFELTKNIVKELTDND